MKISKVDNTKAGITAAPEDAARGARGILYHNPGKANEDVCIELNAHMENLTKKARGLYQVLISQNSPFQTMKDKELKRQGRAVLDAVNAYFAEAVKKKEKQAAERFLQNALTQGRMRGAFLQIPDAVSCIRNGWPGVKKTPDIAALLTDSCLRSSLRKTVSVKVKGALVTVDTAAVVSRLLRALASGSYAKEYGEIPKYELDALLNVMLEDYWKTAQLKKIGTSIARQNVKVQSIERDGVCRLALPGAENEKKKYIFDFLARFANAEEEERMDMLCHLRNLILLFYCGRGAYEEAGLAGRKTGAEKLPDFKFLLPEDGVNFSETAMSLLQEKASTDKREKGAIRRLSDQIAQDLRKRIMTCYRNSAKVPGLSGEDIRWLGYIESAAEKLLLSKRDLSPRRLGTAWLCENTWRDLISYLAMKYVDMGKGVYHFAMPRGDLSQLSPETELICGAVLPEFRKGISSFDYEYIKADESVERELAVYVTFAANNFSRSIVSDESRSKKGKEDIFLWKEDELKTQLYPDTDRRLLRFWGGMSAWEDSDLQYLDDGELALALRKELYGIRNRSFHYAAGQGAGTAESCEAVEILAEQELRAVGRIFRQKYFSNHVYRYYKIADIDRLMCRLYTEERNIPAQIPSFNRLFSKADLMELVRYYVMGKPVGKLSDPEDYKAVLFFLLKEIYYYGFLREADLKERFLSALGALTGQTAQAAPVILKRIPADNERAAQKKTENNQKAMRNFAARIEEIRDRSFPEICQQIMTDYNMQNSGIKDVLPSGKGEERNIYKHYRMLLYLCIRSAFVSYLQNDRSEGTEEKFYEFLRRPEESRREVPEQEFFGKWAGLAKNPYEPILESVRKNPELRGWYVAAHFLSPRYLNLAIGTVKNYIQFVGDVSRRAQNTGNRVNPDSGKKIRHYESVLSVLEFCMLFSGQTSNRIEDYFGDEDAYAGYVERFVDTGFGKKGQAMSAGGRLKAFCERELSVKVNKKPVLKKIGIYYDAMNPIANRNIILASMYGSSIPEMCMERINETEIKAYYMSREATGGALQADGSEDRRELQKKVREFRELQNAKNRIELQDLVTYTELLNDLYAQLISWAYLRERDLMYFQLGIHYIRLFYGAGIPGQHRFRKLEGDTVHIADGALLYQIMAMNTWGLPLYAVDDAGKAYPALQTGSTGARIGKFLRYCGDGEKTYTAGLSLFEKVSEHDDVVDFRNSLDHFKYFVRPQRSILDLYGEIYDRFFLYDPKLRKSVTYIFKNILKRYFVLADTELELTEELVKMREGRRRRMTVLRLRTNTDPDDYRYNPCGLKSDVLTFNLTNASDRKISTGRDVKFLGKESTDARSPLFLKQLYRILNYKMSCGPNA